MNKFNPDRLLKTLELVLAHPEHHNQSTYHCGTAHCFAGFGDCLLRNSSNFFEPFYTSSLVGVDRHWYGISEDAWPTLICGKNTIEQLQLIVAAIARGQGSVCFKDQDLSGVDMSYTFLHESNFTGADLTGAGLTGADLTGANLTRANLTGANLTGAYLTKASLTGANLTRASLTVAYLIGASLTQANLVDADLTGANLTGADLTGANLTGAGLTGANLTQANLVGADLTGAYLTKASLIRTDLTGANLNGADLTRVIQ